MTLHRSSPRAKPRWITLFVVLVTLSVVAAGLAFAHGSTSVPARYAGGTQVDSDPPPAPSVNDEPGQVDMTQMGRDTSVNPNVRIFWSWDSISAWTGKGQTGDACALFDTDDTDANINYVICARVSNTNADPALTELLPAATNKPAYLFDCTNARNDRCSQPTPRSYTAGQVLAGPLAATVAVTQSGAGNLQNETDPFGPAVADGPGEAYPHDTSIEIEVASALVPAGARLANVCSYPSAGNGGNNNPFDCIVTPGIQYGTLVVNKTLVNDNGGTATVGSFSFTVGSGTATTGVVASTAFTPTSTTTGSNSLTLPVGTYSVIEVGTPITGYTTTYSTCTSVSVTAGGSATCTITNNDQAATLIVKKLVINDNGGTRPATDFFFSVNSGTAVRFLQDPNDTDTKKGQNTLTVNAGTYSVTEPTVSGYTTTYSSDCTNVAIANGGTATCTITNNDTIASPGIVTTMQWTLNDSMTLDNATYRTGGGAATATFVLYRDLVNVAACDPSTAVYSPSAVTVADTTGTASTSIGYTTTTGGTYRWVVAYSGNSRNSPITSTCTSEVTVLPIQ